MKGTDVLVSENLREDRVHGTDDFQIQYYEDMLHTFWNKSVPFHWHSEVEFFTILKGKVILQVMDRQIPLTEGQSVFINSNVLHGLYMCSQKDECLLPNIVFSPEILSCAESVIYRSYVLPFVQNKNIPYVIIDGRTDWSKAVSGLLVNIYATFRSMDRDSSLSSFCALDENFCDSDNACPEMAVQADINRIWQLLYVNCHAKNREAFDEKAGILNPVSESRIQRMLKFIQEHYSERLTLNQIAFSADIAKSEATRCFQKYLQKPPVEYLLDYRIERAAELLDNPHYSIQQIAALCGFNDNGYFSKIFRKKTGVSPQEFRRKRPGFLKK